MNDAPPSLVIYNKGIARLHALTINVSCNPLPSSRLATKTRKSRKKECAVIAGMKKGCTFASAFGNEALLKDKVPKRFGGNGLKVLYSHPFSPQARRSGLRAKIEAIYE